MPVTCRAEAPTRRLCATVSAIVGDTKKATPASTPSRRMARIDASIVARRAGGGVIAHLIAEPVQALLLLASK